MPAMADLPLPKPDAGWAWFFDVDGTLIDIAPTPESAIVPREALAALRALQRAASGAVALVSGRDVATLDRMFAPLRLACAGVHGLERRDADGRFSADPPSPALAPLRA